MALTCSRLSEPRVISAASESSRMTTNFRLEYTRRSSAQKPMNSGFDRTPRFEGGDEVETMGLLEQPHEVAEVECFARSGASLKDRKAVAFPAQFLGKIAMPFPAAAPVVETERFCTENRVGRQGDGLTPDCKLPLLN